MGNISALTTALTILDERLALPRSGFLPPGSYTLNADGSVTLNISGGNVVTPLLLLSNGGSIAAPAIALVGDENTGIYWPFGGGGGLAIVQDGLQRAYFDTGGHADFSGSAGVKGPFGTAGSPSFTAGTDNSTGIYRPALNEIAFSSAGVEVWRYSGLRLTMQVPIRFRGYTVATLPAGAEGDRAYVTDAAAPAFLVALVGGGAVRCPAFFNGAAWVAG